ncbi:MAG TPA: Dyp-type peroxidase [Gaiellales bacterium]
MSRPISRKHLLRLAGAAGGGLALGAAGYTRLDGGSSASAESDVEPFHGTYQAGIVTPQQKYLQFGSLDVTATGKAGLRDLMRSLTATAAGLTAGKAGGEEFDPGRLTITFGLGASAFDSRFGIAAHRPPALVDMPHFNGDRLQSELTGGDIGVQCCATSHEVVDRALHAIVAAAQGAATLRWSQYGFVRDPLPGEKGGTPRNIIGFKDGTNNLKPDDSVKMRSNVWVNPGDGPGWMTNGTYLVVRNLTVHVSNFLIEPLDVQQYAIGRDKASGAPFGQTNEFAAVIPGREPTDCHIMVANPRKAGSEAERILRRGYTFTDGYEPQISNPLGGLFFISFQRDPRRQFILIQQRLAVHDRFTVEYPVPRGSALYAVPPGTRPDGYVGESILA